MSLKTQNTKLFSTVRLISVMMLFVMSFSFVLVACSPKKNGNQNQNVYYNVNFDTIGGSVIQSQKVKKGETASRPANPTHPNGYTFVDWYSDITLNNIFNFNTKINSDIKIYAKWESSQSQIFTVTLYANGGVFSNGEGQITKIADAGSLLSPETPTKAGSIFVGWYKDNGTFNDAFNFSTVTISANLSVYAKWEKNDVPEQILTVSFDANGGSNLSIASKEVTVGQSYGVLATVTPPSDKSFNGWYTQSSSGTLVTQGTTVNQSNDHTLYAHYGAKDDSSTSPDAAVNRFKKFLNKDTYE
ncbi:MAG: InlB B-repeat-containing protein, partial [Clostridiales bacterium]|nr:InlB B-repeat-containing protein [Clostridiales bacterium]